METKCNQLDYIFFYFFLKWLQLDMQDSAHACRFFPGVSVGVLVSPLSTVQVSREGSSPNRSWGLAEPRWLLPALGAARHRRQRALAAPWQGECSTRKTLAVVSIAEAGMKTEAQMARVLANLGTQNLAPDLPAQTL